MRFSSILVQLSLSLAITEAFAPVGSLSKQSATTTSTTPRFVLSPEHVDVFFNTAASAAASAAAAANDFHVQQHSQWIADAAVAVEDASKDDGWWQQYLSIFKAILITVHSTIDQPLRSIGIDQTWGISIAIFTAGMRSLLIPLSVQQSKSTEYMKALKPYIAEINEKFKDKPEAKNRAIGKLYEDANQNPLSGCFTSIAQLPILLGLYRGIRNLAQDGVLNERFLWIPSLEGPVSPPDFRGMDWLTQNWVDINGTPTPPLGWETTLSFLIMPVLLVLGQSITMSVLTPPVNTEGMSQQEQEQMESSQGVLKFLPLMIGFFSLQVPAGLTIYWFVSNLFSLSQSLAIKAYYAANPPEIELPDYWNALDDVESMTPEERRAATRAGLNVAPTFESLLEEANFHYVVQRAPLREESAAWNRVVASGGTIPPEMQEWVKNQRRTTPNIGEESPAATTTTTPTPAESSV